MKPPKKPSKEPALPSQDESRRTNVLMEQMLSKFDAFGEVQSDLRERVGRIESRLDKQGEDIEILKVAARTQTNAINANTEATRTLQGDLKKINQRLPAIESLAGPPTL